MKPWAIVIALAAAIILQATLVPYMAVRWFRPDLPLLVLVFVATRRGPLAGVVAGFLTGIAADAVGTDFF
ncbi:MAG TPA: rod shape-determining protein MreD, partial [Bacteroidetes bacterium]|nr:rod shape-determining protein MreD [Bacteroidota bacterium]